MKTLKMICTMTVLALVLSTPTFAGEISSPGLHGEVILPGVTEPAPKPEDASLLEDAWNYSGDVASQSFTQILLTLATLF